MLTRFRKWLLAPLTSEVAALRDDILALRCDVRRHGELVQLHSTAAPVAVAAVAAPWGTLCSNGHRHELQQCPFCGA